MEIPKDLEKDHPFNHPEKAAPDGLVALGGVLTPHLLLLAYERGIFPWPSEAEDPIGWYCPPRRGILEFQELRWPSRFTRWLRNEAAPRLWTLSWNHAFSQVLHGCAQMQRDGQPGTWITPEITRSYEELHQQGHAHSVEVWENNRLIAGIYGVDCQGVFSGESMFHSVSEASKIAFLVLVRELRKAQRSWMDLQILTPHLERWGSQALPRHRYLKKMRQTQQERKLPLSPAKRSLEPLRIEDLLKPNPL